VPFVVIVGLAIAAISGTGKSDHSSSGPLAVLTPAAPPHATAQAIACNKLLAQLPVQLGKLQSRVVQPHPDSPYVVAWGDPAIVLSCGAARPKDLTPGSHAEFVTAGPDTGPFYDVTRSGGSNVFTTVDRAPYIAVVVPAKYQGGDVMPPVSDAIAKALPAVCSTDPNTPDPDKLCTRRRT
jgi:hypothetical protein